MIRALFFGPVAELAGTRELSIRHQNGMRLQDLRALLEKDYPGALDLVCLLAVNGEQVRDMSVQLTDNSEVAFMAKYSGG
jgi:molybdopterin synthase sulfur carrier subunit